MAEDTLIECFEKLEPILRRLNHLMSGERFSYKNASWDVTAVEEKLKKAYEDLNLVKKEIQDVKNKGSEIIAKAESEAKEIETIANSRLVEANKKLMDAESVLNDNKKKKYLKETAAA